MTPPDPSLRLGLRPNLAQFSLLVVINAFVGAMVGLERSILPPLAETGFGLDAKTAVLSFIVVFGLAKAATNYVAGRLADSWGRRPVLLLGWVLAAPVPLLLAWAPSWPWVLVANALLGVSQGLTWSTTVIMKIDLAGPKQRGLAMGLNEAAGYLAVAASAALTAVVADSFGLRPWPFLLGGLWVALGLGLSLAARETRGFVALESREHGGHDAALPAAEVMRRSSYADPHLATVSHVGMVNNLNDGMAWGLFPLVFAAAGLSLSQIGMLAALTPAVWGLGQLFTGAWSDRVGRRPLVVAGMAIQSVGIGAIAVGGSLPVFALGAVLLGAGTALVYPTLLAAIGDAAHPAWRAQAVGVYRLWRDGGYAVGAVLAGVLADLLGVDVALWAVAGLTLLAAGRARLRMVAPAEVEQR